MKLCEQKFPSIQYFDIPPPSIYHHKLQSTNSDALWGFDSTMWEIQFSKPKICWLGTLDNKLAFLWLRTLEIWENERSYLQCLRTEILTLSCRRLQHASDPAWRPLQHGRSGHVIVMATPWSHQLHPPAADDTQHVGSDQPVSRSPYHQHTETNENFCSAGLIPAEQRFSSEANPTICPYFKPNKSSPQFPALFI